MHARHTFLHDMATGHIRLTRAGVDRYGERFARAGFAVCDITTLAAFEAAVDASFALEMKKLASETRGQDPALDAIMAGLPGWD
jgi:hypothetical protein